MKNTIIYLLGFPGTGKYTIAKEICKQANVKIVDNHLINNPIFSLIEKDGITPLPEKIWDIIGRVWDAVLETIVTLSPTDYNFVLTNALIDEGKNDRAWFERVKEGAKQRNATFVPVRLHISVEENKRRIVMPDRAERMKDINPENPKRNAENNTVLRTDHPNLLSLDVTDILPDDAAKLILDHAKSCHSERATRGGIS